MLLEQALQVLDKHSRFLQTRIPSLQRPSPDSSANVLNPLELEVEKEEQIERMRTGLKVDGAVVDRNECKAFRPSRYSNSLSGEG